MTRAEAARLSSFSRPLAQPRRSREILNNGISSVLRRRQQRAVQRFGNHRGSCGIGVDLIGKQVRTTAQSRVQIDCHNSLFPGDLLDNRDDLVFDNIGIDVERHGVGWNRQANEDSRVRWQICKDINHVPQVTRKLILVFPILWFGIISPQHNGHDFRVIIRGILERQFIPIREVPLPKQSSATNTKIPGLIIGPEQASKDNGVGIDRGRINVCTFGNTVADTSDRGQLTDHRPSCTKERQAD